MNLKIILLTLLVPVFAGCSTSSNGGSASTPSAKNLDLKISAYEDKHCGEYGASGIYQDLIDAGYSKDKALNHAIEKFYNGTESCRMDFNARFFKEFGCRPFRL